MRTLVLIVSIFFLTSTCKAEAPSNYIYLPITVSVQKFQEEHKVVTLPKVTTDKPGVRRIHLEDLEEDAGHDMLVGASTKYAGFISSVSPNYIIKRNMLSLTPVPYQRSKDAIMFVFLMNGKKPDPAKAPVWRNKSRLHMHVMGTKKLFKEQTVIENEYPIDISVSRYEDGYSSEDLNMILPSKKPRKVMVALLWSF
jgi:hypothetical protein